MRRFRIGGVPSFLCPVSMSNQLWLGMEFEWNDSKATANLKKHGVSFDEAKSVFSNVLAVIFDDEAHSVSEKREILVRYSKDNRLLLISFTERPNAIRIISARLATRREREDYERQSS